MQLALAASVLALTTLGGLSTTYYLQQQAGAGPAAAEPSGEIDRVVAERHASRPGRAQARGPRALGGRPGRRRTSRRRRRSEGAGPVSGPAHEIQAGLTPPGATRRCSIAWSTSASAEADDPDGSATDARLRRRLPRGRDRPGRPAAGRGGRQDQGPPAVGGAGPGRGAGRLGGDPPRSGEMPPGAARLSAAARAADPDPWRDELRDRPRSTRQGGPADAHCRPWQSRRSSRNSGRSACTCWGPVWTMRGDIGHGRVGAAGRPAAPSGRCLGQLRPGQGAGEAGRAATRPSASTPRPERSAPRRPTSWPMRSSSGASRRGHRGVPRPQACAPATPGTSLAWAMRSRERGRRERPTRCFDAGRGRAAARRSG